MQKNGIEFFLRAAGHVFFWAACLLLLWACGGSGRNATQAPGEINNTLRYDANAHLGTLDPLGDVTGALPMFSHF